MYSSYLDFTSDVKYAFRSVIEEYNLNIIHEDETAIKIGNLTYDINFEIDQMDLQVTFITRSELNLPLGFPAILKFLKPWVDIKTNSTYKHQTREFVNDQLKNYASLMIENFDYVLRGDFSWTKAFINYSKNQQILISKVLALEYENPIYQKFRNGDTSWVTDMTNLP